MLFQNRKQFLVVLLSHAGSRDYHYVPRFDPCLLQPEAFPDDALDTVSHYRPSSNAR